MEKQLYEEVRTWMYQNARHVDLCLWQYFFENGKKEAVVDALMNYQNKDGGFGHALEADNWNPASSPVTTEHAMDILHQIGFLDMEHPIYKGIWKYLNSEKDLCEYGWSFSIPGNDSCPHAPWWTYSEETNRKEYAGITAKLSAFILEYGDKDSSLYQKALKFTDSLLETLLSGEIGGDTGLDGCIRLVDTVKKLGFEKYDMEALDQVLAQKVTDSIEHDIENWGNYVPRPSDYIDGPDSPFYEANAEIVKKELEYLKETKPQDDVWGITWLWFGLMEQYGREFAVSENWWKGYRAVLKMRFIGAFAQKGGE